MTSSAIAARRHIERRLSRSKIEGGVVKTSMQSQSKKYGAARPAQIELAYKQSTCESLQSPFFFCTEKVVCDNELNYVLRFEIEFQFLIVLMRARQASFLLFIFWRRLSTTRTHIERRTMASFEAPKLAFSCNCHIDLSPSVAAAEFCAGARAHRPVNKLDHHFRAIRVCEQPTLARSPGAHIARASLARRRHLARLADDAKATLRRLN